MRPRRLSGGVRLPGTARRRYVARRRLPILPGDKKAYKQNGEVVYFVDVFSRAGRRKPATLFFFFLSVLDATYVPDLG